MSHACSLRSGARGLSAKLNLVVRNSGEIRKKSSLTTSRLGDAVALPFFTPSVASSCQLAIVANCGIVTDLEPPGELLQGGEDQTWGGECRWIRDTGIGDENERQVACVEGERRASTRGESVFVKGGRQ